MRGWLAVAKQFGAPNNTYLPQITAFPAVARETPFGRRFEAQMEKSMSSLSESIETRYDALMFAKSQGEARVAAAQLVRAVLGEAASSRPLKEALKECCRVMRPAADPKDESRYEEEFVELAFWPGRAAQIAA